MLLRYPAPRYGTERLTDRSESQRAGRAPAASSLQEVGTRWRKGCRRRSWRASRPALSRPVWPGRCHPPACPGCPVPCPHPVMTLRPALLPLRLLLLLLLLCGAVCRAEAGFETESPVRTLQVETLVRRR